MFVRIDGVQPGEDHGLDVLEAGQRLDGGAGIVGDGIADLGVGHIFDVGDDEADLAGIERIDFDRLGSEHTEGFDLESPSVRPQADLLAAGERPLKDAREHDNAAIGVKPGIENKSLQVSAG